ncbi:hypothetical protein F2981_14125 [Sinorhizobium meliloti]|nr:hypothetical protein [Sinorhizobium meliloti]
MRRSWRRDTFPAALHRIQACRRCTDRTDYQTVYAREEGAVAAPTAGAALLPPAFRQAWTRRGSNGYFVHTACRCGTFLRSGRRYRRPRDARGIGHVDPVTAASSMRARTRRPHRLCRHDIASADRRAQPRRRSIRPWSGATGIFINAGYRFRRSIC